MNSRPEEYVVLTSEEAAFSRLTKAQIYIMANQFIRTKPTIKNHQVLSFISEYLVFGSHLWKFCRLARHGGATTEQTKKLIENSEDLMLTVTERPENSAYSLEGYKVETNKPAIRGNLQYFYDALPLDIDLHVKVLEELMWIHATFLNFCGQASSEKKLSRHWKRHIDEYLALCPIIKVG